MEKILSLQSMALNSIDLTLNYFKTIVIKSKAGWGYRQFLDDIKENEHYIGLFGTCCGVNTLLCCGETKNTEIIKNLCEFIINQENEINKLLYGKSTNSKFSITNRINYTLMALGNADYTLRGKIVDQGILWLSRNMIKDIGWGFFSGENIGRTSPTANAIRALSHFNKKIDPKLLKNATNCIINLRNEDNGWGQHYKDNSTIAHTSLSIISLIESGFHDQLKIIQDSIEFLINRLDLVENSSITEFFYFPTGEDSNDSLARFYHLPTLSLLTICLLTCQFYPTDKRIKGLVKGIIDNQSPKGFWQDDSVPRKIPIWATMYSIIALRKFVDAVDNVKDQLLIKEEIARNNLVIINNRKKIEIIEDKVRYFEKHIDPLLKLINSFVRYKLLILYILLTVILISLALIFDWNKYMEIGVIILSSIITFSELLKSINSKNKDRENGQ